VLGQWALNDENIKRIDPRGGETILHNYCQFINTTPFEVFKYLIEIKGCNINIQDHCKDTPPYYALRHFNPNRDDTVAILQYLLSQEGVNINTKGYFGRTLLHKACEFINKLPLDIFKLLIEIKGADVNVLHSYKNTPLHYALDSFDPNCGDISILTYLLTQNTINMKIKDQYGRTLTHLACISDFSGISEKEKGKADTVGSQLIEIIAQGYLRQISDEVP
jgi:hypothetical protein